jgi:hypothetical protein
LLVSAAPHPDVAAIREALAGMEAYHVTLCAPDKLNALIGKCDMLIIDGITAQTQGMANTILQARKPYWLMLTDQTYVPAVNVLKDVSHLSVSASGIRNIQAIPDPAFSAFTLPARLMTVAEKMPPLSANVGNILTAPGTMSLFVQKTGAIDTRTPVWVLQQGDVPVAYLEGEGLWRWRLHEFRNFGTHDVIDECIRQTVSFLGTLHSDKPFYVTSPKPVWNDQESVVLQATLLNPNREQVNTPDVTLSLFDSAGRRTEFSMERNGTSYRLNLGIRSGGLYTYTATTKYNGVALTASGSFAVQTVPVELMETGSDSRLLFGLANRYSGAYFTPATMAAIADSIRHNGRIRPVIRTEHESVPLVERKWYFFLILILLTTEWLWRKYRMAQ